MFGRSRRNRGGAGGEQGHGGGRGHGGGFGKGPGGNCICPNCGHITPHRQGQPCYQQTCPQCGTKMTRQR